MNSKQVPATHYVYRVFCLALVAAGLVAALPGHARATLFSPSVEAVVNAQGAQTNASQPSGPVVLANSGTHYSFGVWTDYGINRATSSVAVSTSWYSPVVSGSATSKWTDVLTINVPNLSYGTPLSFLFSFRLDGSLSAHEDNFTTAKAFVRFYSQPIGIDGIYAGSVSPNFVAQIIPTPSSTSGGDASAVIDEILYGNYKIHNGEPFNLIAILDTMVEGNLMGPPGSLSADSLFGSSAEYLGGSVEANGAPVSFTITSGSGFNYGNRSATPPPTAVPEPSTILLLGAGLAGLGLWGRKRMGRS